MTRKTYLTDLSDAEWHRLSRLVPQPKPGGRPLKYPRRLILNAIFYLVRAGCPWRMLPSDLPPWRMLPSDLPPWRMLPSDLPPWRIVYHYFRTWTRSGWWQHLHDHLRGQLRAQEGRRPQPTAAILDSQTIKTASPTSERGFDAAKKMTGRKRHVLVDTLGLIWLLVIHPAQVQDRDGARLLLASLSSFCHRLRLIWADGAYAGALVQWVTQLRCPNQRAPLQLEIVKRSDTTHGFVVLPKRWIVERTFGWLSRSRRLCKDYETQVSHSQAMVLIAMSHLMLRRLHNKGTF
jgi:putative transposase